MSNIFKEYCWIHGCEMTWETNTIVEGLSGYICQECEAQKYRQQQEDRQEMWETIALLLCLVVLFWAMMKA